jgi:hypothetical protein|mmetsp:Transcript_31173/g.56460  ORF Transcript_31173/g.56460 Transcript_31173/m.56460 type:complete len:158 (+) Transcript_31173:346-819(+)
MLNTTDLSLLSNVCGKRVKLLKSTRTNACHDRPGRMLATLPCAFSFHVTVYKCPTWLQFLTQFESLLGDTKVLFANRGSELTLKRNVALLRRRVFDEEEFENGNTTALTLTEIYLSMVGRKSTSVQRPISFLCMMGSHDSRHDWEFVRRVPLICVQN